jgi:hypothetical protein
VWHLDQRINVDHRYVTDRVNAIDYNRCYPYKENCQISNGALAVSHPTHSRIEVLLPNHRKLPSGRHNVADSTEEDLVSDHSDAEHEGSSDDAHDRCNRRIAHGALTDV